MAFQVDRASRPRYSKDDGHTCDDDKAHHHDQGMTNHVVDPESQPRKVQASGPDVDGCFLPRRRSAQVRTNGLTQD
jgi:hypothetical protein